MKAIIVTGRVEGIAELRELLKQMEENPNRIYRSVMVTAQNDKRFEKLVQSVTIDRVAGASALAKGKIKFEK